MYSTASRPQYIDDRSLISPTYRITEQFDDEEDDEQLWKLTENDEDFHANIETTKASSSGRSMRHEASVTQQSIDKINAEYEKYFPNSTAFAKHNSMNEHRLSQSTSNLTLPSHIISLRDHTPHVSTKAIHAPEASSNHYNPRVNLHEIGSTSSARSLASSSISPFRYALEAEELRSKRKTIERETLRMEEEVRFLKQNLLSEIYKQKQQDKSRLFNLVYIFQVAQQRSKQQHVRDAFDRLVDLTFGAQERAEQFYKETQVMKLLAMWNNWKNHMLDIKVNTLRQLVKQKMLNAEKIYERQSMQYHSKKLKAKSFAGWYYYFTKNKELLARKRQRVNIHEIFNQQQQQQQQQQQRDVSPSFEKYSLRQHPQLHKMLNDMNNQEYMHDQQSNMHQSSSWNSTARVDAELQTTIRKANSLSSTRNYSNNNYSQTLDRRSTEMQYLQVQRQPEPTTIISRSVDQCDSNPSMMNPKKKNLDLQSTVHNHHVKNADTASALTSPSQNSSINSVLAGFGGGNQKNTPQISRQLFVIPNQSYTPSSSLHFTAEFSKIEHEDHPTSYTSRLTVDEKESNYIIQGDDDVIPLMIPSSADSENHQNIQVQQQQQQKKKKQQQQQVLSLDDVTVPLNPVKNVRNSQPQTTKPSWNPYCSTKKQQQQQQQQQQGAPQKQQIALKASTVPINVSLPRGRQTGIDSAHDTPVNKGSTFFEVKSNQSHKVPTTEIEVEQQQPEPEYRARTLEPQQLSQSSSQSSYSSSQRQSITTFEKSKNRQHGSSKQSNGSKSYTTFKQRSSSISGYFWQHKDITKGDQQKKQSQQYFNERAQSVVVITPHPSLASSSSGFFQETLSSTLKNKHDNNSSNGVTQRHHNSSSIGSGECLSESSSTNAILINERKSSVQSIDNMKRAQKQPVNHRYQDPPQSQEPRPNNKLNLGVVDLNSNALRVSSAQAVKQQNSAAASLKEKERNLKEIEKRALERKKRAEELKKKQIETKKQKDDESRREEEKSIEMERQEYQKEYFEHQAIKRAQKNAKRTPEEIRSAEQVLGQKADRFRIQQLQKKAFSILLENHECNGKLEIALTFVGEKHVESGWNALRQNVANFQQNEQLSIEHYQSKLKQRCFIGLHSRVISQKIAVEDHVKHREEVLVRMAFQRLFQELQIKKKAETDVQKLVNQFRKVVLLERGFRGWNQLMHSNEMR